jgi:hypothetical protein
VEFLITGVVSFARLLSTAVDQYEIRCNVTKYLLDDEISRTIDEISLE